MGMTSTVVELLVFAAPTPSPTPTFDPVEVTPGPVGFFATIGLMLAVGLIAMAFMRQSTRAAAKYDLRERVEAEAKAERAANESRGADAGASTAATEADADRSGQ